MPSGETIYIIGGDQRNEYLSSLFAAAGYPTCTFALRASRPDWPDLGNARWIVGPIPFTADGEHLHAPYHADRIAIGTLLAAIPPAATLFAGTIPAGHKAACHYVDLTRNVALYDRNIVPTCEGIVQALLNHIDFTLAGTRVLIAGCGKVGKHLARLLRALDADVSIYSADPAEQREIASRYQPATLDDLSGYPIVVNTIPARVFDRARLATLGHEAILLDVASQPGGVDPELAARAGIRLLQAPGLPGKKAPRSVAAAMLEVIVRHIDDAATRP